MAIKVVEISFNKTGPFKLVQTLGLGLAKNLSHEAYFKPKQNHLGLGVEAQFILRNKPQPIIRFGPIESLELCGQHTIKITTKSEEFLLSIG